MTRGIMIIGLFALLAVSGCIAGPNPFPQRDAALQNTTGPPFHDFSDAAAMATCAEDQNGDKDGTECMPGGSGDVVAADVNEVGADGADAGDAGPDGADDEDTAEGDETES